MIKFRLFVLISGLILLSFLSKPLNAQVLDPDEKTDYYLIHSSGMVINDNSEGRTIIETVSGAAGQYVQFVPDGTGYYWVKLDGLKKYMALSGNWNTYFITDSTTDASRYAIEKVSSYFVKLKCKANGKYLGTDGTVSGAYVYSDKSGTDSKHFWYINQKYSAAPIDSMKYLINPAARFKNEFEGWGVSLCWWANMCGKWDENKIDELVDWLVSPEGLNYSIFRYNIGGGDDPLNRHCTPHHMANGKGLRAEMDGFKDSLNADYDWSRDAAQRKIMLKIKEKRPDAIFEAFSNSAPYYMTYSGCCAGNVNASDDNLKPEYYNDFAHYLVDVCKFYKDSFNIEFKTLAPFNEPVTNYWGANGGQEGCHFSTSAQIAFIKTLAPVLQASGLKTIISSSDETSTSQSVTDFKAYVTDASVLDLVGQWNTHTYSATNQTRANIRALSTAHNKTLWMSEVGAGGSGIGGNLNLAKKLMDDIRYIRPEAWIDWQYVEEGNDQWCLVRGNFSAQAYARVKNFYVRKQFTHYIDPGSTFLSMPNDQMLAALTPDGDALVVVLLNNSALETVHQLDLSMFDGLGNTIDVSRTSETENNASVSDYEFNDSTLMVKLPAYSVTTVVIPVTLSTSMENTLKTDVPYLIVPRIATLVMQATGSAVEISNFEFGDMQQLWKLTSKGSGYSITNLAGERLTDIGSYYSTVSSVETEGQTFRFESVGDGYYKITSEKTGKALDLEGEGNISGTKLGFYAYGNSPAVSHRQWELIKAPSFSHDDNGTSDSADDLANLSHESVRVFGTYGAITIMQTTNTVSEISIYNVLGKKIIQQQVSSTFCRIPMAANIYLVSYKMKTHNNVSVTKVMVL